MSGGETSGFAGRIVRLQSENYKRLKAVEITPEGNIITIGGENGAGKSSCLDSIAAALGGKDAIAEVPVRKGEKKASIVLDLGDIVVKRTFTAEGGTALKVTNQEGAVFPSPQAMLDKLIGKLSFDPLAFLRLDGKKQAEALRQLVGVDTSAIEAERKALYDERTLVGREVDRLTGHAKSLPLHEDVPEMPVSMTDLNKELEAARATNRENKATRELIEARTEELADGKKSLGELDATIALLEEQLKAARDQRQKLDEHLQKAEGTLAIDRSVAEALVDIDTDPILERIRTAEETNEKVRANQRREEAIDATLEKEGERAELTTKIDALDAQKAKLLTEARFPIEGLGFDANGVSFNGLPLSQASQAEQIRVSVAMGAAFNSKLRVILVRDASLLDKKSMALLSDLAKEHDLQVWLEVVSEEGVSVVIEDGAVREPEAETVEAAS